MGEAMVDIFPFIQSLTWFVAMPWTSWDASDFVAGV